MSHRHTVLLMALAQAACSSASPGARENVATDGGATGATGTSQASGSGEMAGATAGGTAGAAGGAAGSTAGNATGTATGTTASTGQGSTGSAGSPATTGNPDGGSPCVVGCEGRDGGAGSSDAQAADGASGPPVAILTSLVANQSGRTGDDLLLTVQATDVNRTAFALDIQLGDKDGQPVNAFRDWSGNPSAWERIVLFDGSSAAGQSSFSRTVTLAGFMKAFPSIATVVVAVVDTLGTSRGMTMGVTLQSVDNLQQSCDPAVITDRCAAGLACNATTSTCTNPAPPSIAQFAYVTSPPGQGARALFAGPDSADDLDQIHLEFLDAESHPVQIDLTGNQDLASTFDISVAGASTLGQFFYADQTTQGFDGTVTQLAATPSGSSSGPGARVTAMLAAPVVAALGGACDLRGFASCAVGASCVKDPTSGKSTCVATTAALTTATANASTLDPAGGTSFVTGYATGTNLWGDAPSDCVPPGVHGLPEGVALLHLATSVPSLVLTTDNQETNVEAAIFVLKGTGAGVGTKSLGCSEGYPSTVSLTNLAAGDYTVVIGSATPTGGNFGLRIP